MGRRDVTHGHRAAEGRRKTAAGDAANRGIAIQNLGAIAGGRALKKQADTGAGYFAGIFAENAVGAWKIGDNLAHDGAGDRIQGGQLEKRKENGGLCQNCHGLAPDEINVGNVGPSLAGYGERGRSEAIAKFTYEKIYNAWAYFPCSKMPRLGATGHLTPEQITHMVAYLIDPASPVNRK